MQPKAGIGVKAMVVKDGKVLLIRRSDYTPHNPGKWDIPGGRLEEGEDHLDGLAREVLEETGLKLEIEAPLSVESFTRQDGQHIVLIIFLCTPLTGKITLSKEHTESMWMPVGSNEIPDWLKEAAEAYLLHYSAR